MTEAKQELKIGDIESTGDHKGETYGGIWTREYGGDDKPIWFSEAPECMNHFRAAAWAEKQGGALPTSKQTDYLMTLKGKGLSEFLTEIFNRGDSFPAGFAWLAETSSYYGDQALSLKLADGDGPHGILRLIKMPVLIVRR